MSGTHLLTSTTTRTEAPYPSRAAGLNIAPADPSERLFAIDALRGFAVLGILLMNLPALGLPFELHYNPAAYGGASRCDLWTWALDSVLFEGKFRAIFSMLYGASVILLTSRLARRAGESEAADIYYRRTLWLLFFGLAHICFVWNGDILFIFGVCGLVLFPLRRVAPRNLMIAGLFVFSMLAANHYRIFRTINSMRVKAAEATMTDAARKPLNAEQRQSQKMWADELKRLQPSSDEITQEIRYHLGSYWKGLANRTENAGIMFGLFGFPYESLGMMLIGMALVKMGVLSAERSYREYILMAILGFGIGFSSSAYVVWRNIHDNFSPGKFFSATCCGHLTSPSYDIERLSAALGYIALFMLVVKARLLRRLTEYFAAAGRMALTNYLMQTITCVLLFDCVGLGLYGRLHRLQLILYVLLPIWAFQLFFSVLWLRYFRFGPFEWVWRSLTYWKVQPMRISPPVNSVNLDTVMSSGVG